MSVTVDRVVWPFYNVKCEMSPSVRKKRSLGAWSPSAEPENILLYLRSNVHKLVLQLIDSRTL